MKVCIVLNGEVKNYSKTKEIIVNENYDYIIAADGGCNHLYKMNITPDYITVGVFEKGADEYKDAERPDVTPYAHVKLTSAGEIDVHSKGNVTVTNDADVSITISGNSDITINGNCNIKVSGSCNIDSPDVNITGASLTVNGTAAPSGSGPFCGIPACLFTGAPHVGNKSTGN